MSDLLYGDHMDKKTTQDSQEFIKSKLLLEKMKKANVLHVLQ